MKVSESLTPAEEDVLSAVKSLRDEEEGPVRTKWVRNRTGKDASTTSDLLSGLVEKEAVVRVRKGWYDLPKQAGSESEEATGGPLVSIPLFSIRTGAEGSNLALEEEMSEYVSYDREQLRRETAVSPDQLAVLLISGTGMKPTLRPGEKALVACTDRVITKATKAARDEQSSSQQTFAGGAASESLSGERLPLRDGSIYLFQNEVRGAIVKRLWWEEGGIMRLESDNPEGATIRVDPTGEERWAVLSRFIRVEKNL